MRISDWSSDVCSSDLRLRAVEIGMAALDEFGVDRAVDDDMRDMDALRPQFARLRLGEHPQRRLGPRKGREARSAAQARRRAGDADGPAAARRQALRTTEERRGGKGGVGYGRIE